LIYTTIKDLPVDLPDSVSNVFAQVSDELMGYANDPHQKTYRLVRFSVNHELYLLLTNRLDLTTFQVIMLYAYRWQIELLFRFLKRTMNGIHLVRHDATGVTIQFYAMLIVALLQLHLKQRVLDLDDVADHTDTLSAEKEDISMPQESPADSPLSAVESRPHDREKPDTPSDNDTLPELKNKPCASSRLGISIYTIFPRNCRAVASKLPSSSWEYASMISSMERKTHKPANSAGLVNSFLCLICLPLSLIKNTRNSAASLLLSAAIAHTVTQAMLTTNKRLAIAAADSCCQDSK